MGCKPDIMGLYRHPSKKFLNHHESVVMIRYDKELVWLLETLTSFLIVSLMIRWSSTCRDLDHGTQSEESQLCTKWPRFHNWNTCNMLQPSTKQISIQTFGAELPSCKCSFALVVAWKYRPAPDCLRFLWNLPRAMENCWASRDLQKKKHGEFLGEILLNTSANHDLYPRNMMKNWICPLWSRPSMRPILVAMDGNHENYVNVGNKNWHKLVDHSSHPFSIERGMVVDG